MSGRIIALILSFIYCGFGQIYKRQIMKGIDFIIIYTVLILSFFFSPSISPSPLLRYSILSVISLLWTFGMADAYVDSEMFAELLTSRKLILLIIILLVILPGVVIMLLAISGILPASHESSKPDIQKTPTSLTNASVVINEEAINQFRIPRYGTLIPSTPSRIL